MKASSFYLGCAHSTMNVRVCVCMCVHLYVCVPVCARVCGVVVRAWRR